MIKIIEPGTRRITRCTECGCKFSYENDDIKKDGFLTNNLVFIGKTLVVCPQCGKENVLSTTR